MLDGSLTRALMTERKWIPRDYGIPDWK